MPKAARPLRPDEQALVAHLQDGCVLPSDVRVVPLRDGDMGSLSFVSGKAHRRPGREAGACTFRDADGVLVVATLLLDKEGDLFELDIWKVDFSPLIRIPNRAAFLPLHSSGD